MFPNARNTVVNGGTFTMQGDFHLHRVADDGRKCEPIMYISTVKILIAIHSDGAFAATYCSRRISQL